jgi:hypothetical protein
MNGEIMVNQQHTDTDFPPRESTPSASFSRRAVRLLLRGPAELRSPASRWAVNLLAIAGAAMLVWSAVIHLRLWAYGFSDISIIGPLFMIQGIGGILVAAVLVFFRRLVLLVAGAITNAATAVGLLLSVNTGLFGYRESLAVTYAELSLAVEFTGAVVLTLAAVITLCGPGRQSNTRGRT